MKFVFLVIKSLDNTCLDQCFHDQVHCFGDISFFYQGNKFFEAFEVTFQLLLGLNLMDDL